MNKNYLLFSLIFTLALTTQGQDNALKNLQQKIKEFYPQTPDSSIYYLKTSLKITPHHRDSIFTEDYIRLSRSYAQLQKKDSTDYYFKKALNHAKSNYLKGRTYLKWGQSYRDFGYYNKANTTLDLADSLFKIDNNLKGIGNVLLEKATVNHYTQNTQPAIEQLQEAIKIFKEIEAQEDLSIAKMELAGSYLMNDNYDFANKLYAEVLSELEKEKGLLYYITLVNYGDTFFIPKSGKRQANTTPRLTIILSHTILKNMLPMY